MRSVYTYRHDTKNIMVSFELDIDKAEEELMNEFSIDELNEITGNKADDYYLDDVQDIKK